MLIKSSDAQGATVPDPLGLFAGNINNDGNISEVVHDGLGRTIRSIRELRLDGQGGNPLDLSNPANSDGKIVETTTYNKNSRVTSVSDDNGNDTTYQYDNLNRLVTTTQADGRTISYEYDRDNNMISYIDHNGTICTHQFDEIHRLVQKNITRSITNNIVGTTAQTFEYDGLSRLTKATDNNDPADTTDDSTVIRKYDSLSRMVEEQQNNESILLGWREISELAERIYPNNRKINYSYDKLDRLKTISDNSDNSNPVATYDYIGYRLLERTYKNNTRLTMLNDAGDTNIGYDEAPRLIEMRHLKQDNTLVAGYAYNYNRVNFQTSKLILDQPQLSEVYKLDSLYRVVDFKRGTLNGNQTTIVGPAVNTQDWQIDGVGNWAKTTIDGTAQNQTVNNMNEYDSFGAVSFAHDDNGNMIDDGQHLFTYDAMNRITTVIDKASNELIATYKYDVMNRRTSKQFKRTAEIQNGDNEYTPDADTVALYHYNQKSGKVIDSSGNNNHGKAPRFIKRGIEGLFGTKAVQIKKLPITVKDSKSFSEIEDQLTVETFVFIDSKKWKHCTTGALVHKLGSFELEIDRKTRKACFTVRTQKIKNKKNRKHKKRFFKKFKHDKAKVCSDNKIPQDQWVHIAGVYDGDKLNIYINCQKQQDEQQINGDIKDNRAPMFLGGFGLTAKLEETRISSVARTEFNCNPTNGGSGQETVTVKRSFFYSGWRVIEEREQTASQGQGFGSEKVTRQYVDGAGIDEHLTVDTYNEDGTAIESTLYFHENTRGDTIALTDENGDTHSRIEYTTYGEAFAIDENNELIPLENADEIVYTFQGRRVDAETGLMYYRNRYYNQKLGRFLQRDPLGYVDSYGLYEAFAGNPYGYRDPLGKRAVTDGSVGLEFSYLIAQEENAKSSNVESSLEPVINLGVQGTFGLITPFVNPININQSIEFLNALAFIADRTVYHIVEMMECPAWQSFFHFSGIMGAMVGMFFGAAGGSIGGPGGTLAGAAIGAEAGTVLGLIGGYAIGLIVIGVFGFGAAVGDYVVYSAEHTNNARNSTKGKHERAKARKEKEQAKAQEKGKGKNPEQREYNDQMSKANDALRNMPRKQMRQLQNNNTPVNIKENIIKDYLDDKCIDHSKINIQDLNIPK